MSEFHPIQADNVHRYIPERVALRAYEVYCELYGPQPALVDLPGRGCRGGFGVNELVGFLYARSFPRHEWQARFEEAIERKPVGGSGRVPHQEEGQ